VIGLPPSKGAPNETDICVFPGVTVGCAGASGTRFGLTTADATDAGPSPFAFVAVTVHVYDLPFVNPVTTSGELGPEVDPPAPPSEDVQVAA